MCVCVCGCIYGCPSVALALGCHSRSAVCACPRLHPLAARSRRHTDIFTQPSRCASARFPPRRRDLAVRGESLAHSSE